MQYYNYNALEILIIKKTVLNPTQVICLRYKSILDNNTKGIRQISSVTFGRKNVIL